ncbi:hypothetical protein IFR09_10210 [Pseudomonas syringae]|nr:hypothetical protein [Pseudomonas syringae]MBD8576681.1 hypothetical protein [Pseudomonas syringae]MBD8788458.1 hypothetical protein [Pseudomonas syringae]MBD8799342.1 hypothetical protein [Pseudomonas syringae]MBD8811539.1 hypothetical protein [Pseudomonas syringae]
MNQLIINGNFDNQVLAPWISNAQEEPVFEPYKPGGYSLTIESNTEIQQKLDTAHIESPCRLEWTFSARLSAKAHMGGAMFMLFSARVGQEFYLDTGYVSELTDEWQTFNLEGATAFPVVHEGLYAQFINARKVDENGPVSAPVQITGISVRAVAQP